MGSTFSYPRKECGRGTVDNLGTSQADYTFDGG